MSQKERMIKSELLTIKDRFLAEAHEENPELMLGSDIINNGAFSAGKNPYGVGQSQKNKLKKAEQQKKQK